MGAVRSSASVGLALVAVAASVSGRADSASARQRPELTWKVEQRPVSASRVYQGARLLVREHTGRERAPARASATGSTRAARSADADEPDQRRPHGDRRRLHRRDHGAATDGDRDGVTRIQRGSGSASTLGSGGDGGPHGLRGVRRPRRTSTTSAPVSTGTTSTCAGQIVPIKVWSRLRHSQAVRRSTSAPAATGSASLTTSVGRMAFGRGQAKRPCASSAPLPARSRPGYRSSRPASRRTRSRTRSIRDAASRSCASYAARTGRPPLPDPTQFAVTKWRDGIGSAAELTEDADQFAAAGIPLGWVIIDNPWERGDAASARCSFDPRPVPRSKGHDRARSTRAGIRVMMWVSPMVQSHLRARDIYPDERAHRRRARTRRIDLTDPSASGDLRATDARGCWRSGSTDSRSIAATRSTSSCNALAQGSGNDVHNAYPTLVAQRGRRSDECGAREAVPTLFRAGFTGSQ